jgi:hypothetical protein
VRGTVAGERLNPLVVPSTVHDTWVARWQYVDTMLQVFERLSIRAVQTEAMLHGVCGQARVAGTRTWEAMRCGGRYMEQSWTRGAM